MKVILKPKPASSKTGADRVPQQEISGTKKPGGSSPASKYSLHTPRFVGSETVLAAYFQEIRDCQVLTSQEEVALAQRIRKGDREALKTLVQANLKFVVAVCRNYQNQGVPFEDLISEGNLGLLRAAKRFDETLNCKFISYAVWWIRQAILVALADQSRVFNVPLGRVAQMHKVGKAITKLEQKLGRSPTLSELSKETEIGIGEINENFAMANTKSLDASSQEDESGCLEEVLEDINAEGPDLPAITKSLEIKLSCLLDTLERREAEVLRLYFGLGAYTTYSLEEIGMRIDLTRERVRQIKEKALGRLRHPSRIKALMGLFP